MLAPYVAASEIVLVTAFLRNRYGKDYNEAIEKKLGAILNAPRKYHTTHISSQVLAF